MEIPSDNKHNLARKEGKTVNWYLIVICMSLDQISILGAPSSPNSRQGSQSTAIGKAFAELNEALRKDSPLPLYRRMADHLKDWIEAGRLQPGWQLPSERTMSETLAISRRTVRAALGDLIAHRYVSATHGCGNFVLDPPKKREVRILALERFQREPVFLTPPHHDRIHEAEAHCNAVVHYKYVPTVENLRTILESPPSGYDGLLLYRPSQEWIDLLLENDGALSCNRTVPLLISSRCLAGSGYHYISPDHREQTRVATRKLIELGHQRIGFISGLYNQAYMQMTREGYESSLREAGLPMRPEDCLELKTIEPGIIEKAIQSFLAQRGFTALVVAGSAFSIPFENAIQRAAIHVPSELSVILITEKSSLGNMAIRWSAHLYSEQVIPRSLEVLVQLAENPAAGPFQELLPFEEVPGATCAPRSEK
jgi:DNA-binding LacI/PurR family transcriptional regulator/DNA-binding transcriptional regulator YhcF (GntR family)